MHAAVSAKHRAAAYVCHLPRNAHDTLLLVVFHFKVSADAWGHALTLESTAPQHISSHAENAPTDSFHQQLLKAARHQGLPYQERAHSAQCCLVHCDARQALHLYGEGAHPAMW